MKLEDLLPNIKETISRSYEDIRCPEYEDILKKMMRRAVPSVQPKLVHMGGIPGAGKTTFTRNYPMENMVYIGFDAVMSEIKGYKEDIKVFGSEEGFKKWEMPARIIGYELLRRCVEMRTNIFFDHSGCFASHIDLVHNIRKYHYTTDMYFILCDIEVAYQRALLREEWTMRHTPREMIEERFKLSEKYIKIYRDIVDNFYLYDTTNNSFELKEEKHNLLSETLAVAG